MSDSVVRSVALMDTVITIEVVGHAATEAERATRDTLVQKAAAWFERAEAACSRFSASSEVVLLAKRPGEAVRVSPLVFESVRVGLTLAAETEGAFDPTVGAAMEHRGFNREYRSGATFASGVAVDAAVSYHDVALDETRRTITLARPLLLDLGAIVKGLAVDLAARELAPLENFAIDAGGDLYLAGHNARDEPWTVGIRHPRHEKELLVTLHVSNAAVCTSGDYERRAPNAPGHHILDARSGQSAERAVSATVVGPHAVIADACATAAFIMGPEAGLALLGRSGLDGIIVAPTFEQHATAGMKTYRQSKRD